MKLIDKSTLVAEIERWIELLTNEKNQEGISQIDKLSLGGRIAELQEVKSLLNTLEVKEVDLDTNFGVCWGEYCDCGGNINDYEIVKHFFELGIAVSNKAQKGE